MNRVMRIGNKEFHIGSRTYVMGILNLTPDSFSDGGNWMEKDRALYRVQDMITEGVDLLDIGGESTRPGYKMISIGEEIDRITPVIESVKQRFDIPVSLDTYKSGVALAGIQAGADMINDIWGLQYDPDMAGVIATSGLPCCLMHNRKAALYRDFLKDVAEDLKAILRRAYEAGIHKDRIILDPGIGFAKDFEQNLEMLRHPEVMKDLDMPMLLGCSRKSVIGNALELPVEDRLEGTLATTVMAVEMGYSFVRVHDIKENVRAIRMTEKILGRAD